MRKLLLYHISIFILLGVISSCKSDEQTTNADDKLTDDLSNQIEKELDNPELYYQRAQHYYKTESYDEAISDLKQAIALDLSLIHI